MNIEQIGSKDGKEYILFRAKKGVCLHNYAIYDTTYDKEGNKSNKWPHFYRFPKGDAMEEDGYICLYTDDSDSQATFHGQRIKTFHMGLDKVLNKQGDGVFLIKVEDIDSKSI